MHVAGMPGHLYNPLFIYGGVGLGKTHLAHAIGNRIADDHPNLRVLYLTSEAFTNAFVHAVQQNMLADFARSFREIDVLIVDDIQDVSEERRGGPCAHLIYGEPLCINAGTAAYFMCEHLIKAPNLTDSQLNKVYQLYFACLRGGHAGQALDRNVELR